MTSLRPEHDSLAGRFTSEAQLRTNYVPMRERLLYASENGDRWSLAREPVTGEVIVRHRANLPSGGQVSDIRLGAFLVQDGLGPEKQATQLGHGIKAINDPRLVTDFADPLVPFDVADWHVYAVEWTPDGVSFLLDGETLRHVAQSPDYPMQLMLDVFAFADAGTAEQDWPNSFSIDWVRGHVVAEAQQP
jgi:hypothetical protein